MKKIFVILILILPLGACSWFETKEIGAELVETNDLGTNTKDLLKTLPKGFPSDTQNARHTGTFLRAEDKDNGIK
ncbi:MAG: hypothetical protein ACKVIX_06140 [Sphingomonadales bacterium]|jgi:hypothetical protein